MNHFLVEFSNWIQRSSISGSLRDMAWVMPTVQSIHIAAIGAVIISALMIYLPVLKVNGGAEPVAATVRRVMPWAWRGLGLLVLTGVIEILVAPRRPLQSPAFHIKMIMIVAAFAIAALFQRVTSTDSEFWARSYPRIFIAKMLAIVSLLLFAAIIFAGRLTAYVPYGGR